MAGWIIYDDSASHANPDVKAAKIHNNSGEFTYGNSLCPCTPAACSTNEVYSVKAIIEQDSGDFDTFNEYNNGIISKTLYGNSCCEEGLVVWFNNGSNYSYNTVYTFTGFSSIVDIKNVDDCEHVIIAGNGGVFYRRKHKFENYFYIDSGYPYIDDGTNHPKYSSGARYAGHKFRYRTINNTLPSKSFKGMADIVEVYFPRYNSDDSGTTITEVGQDAFNGCNNLTAITFNAVERINSGACSSCTSLRVIDWGHNIGGTGCGTATNLKYIGNAAFHSCRSLTEVNIPNTVTEIGERAFFNCSGATSLTISSNVSAISKSCFGGMKNITNIAIPNKVTTIDTFAFAGCSNLTGITWSQNLTTLDNAVFSGCTSLTNVSIPPSVTNIGRTTFSCPNLVTFNINSMPTIEFRAFSGCTNLENISFGPSVSGVSDFHNCFYTGNTLSTKSLNVTLNYDGVVSDLTSAFSTNAMVVTFIVSSSSLRAQYEDAYPLSTRPAGWLFQVS